MKIFATFSFLWAFSALLDLVTSSLLTRSLVHGLLAGSCLAVMLRPRSIGFFVAMNALRLAAFVDETPVTPNHQVLFSVCSLAILGAFVTATWRARGPRAVGAEAWLASFAPMLRASVVALYFFAVFHKLNVDYLDPSVSCAVDLFLLVSPGWLADAIRAFPAMHPALVYGSLAIEAAIPILLLVPRTRPMGLAIGVLFHAFLGLGFYAFSTGLFALYLMFVPATVFDAADDWLAAHRARGGLRALLLQPTVWRVATVAFSVALAVVWVQARSLGPTLVLFWFAGVLLFLALPYATRTARAGFADPLAGRLFPTGAALLIPALLFANGLSPYLGLRTTPTFSMFSNLRTIGGSNHLIVPNGALRIAGYQDDLIVILDTDDQELDRFAKRGRRRVFYSFKGRIQSMAARGKTDIAVTWRRGDQTVSVASAERHPELAAPIPWYERKFLRFRPGPIGARKSCSW